MFYMKYKKRIENIFIKFKTYLVEIKIEILFFKSVIPF